MRQTTAAWLLIGTLACGDQGSAPEAPPAVEQPVARAHKERPVDTTVTYMLAAGEVRVEADVTPLGTLTYKAPLHIAVLRTGEIESLSYLRGYVMADLHTFGSGDERRDRDVRDDILRMSTDHTQAAFDLETLSDLDVPLTVGGSARAQAVGMLQVGAHAQDAFFDVVVTRPSETTLHIETDGPFEMSLQELALDERIVPVLQRYGAKRIGQALRVSVILDLEDAGDRPLPVIFRTPVTVHTYQEVEAKREASVDRFQIYQDNLKAQGAPKGTRAFMTREVHEKIMEARRAQGLE